MASKYINLDTNVLLEWEYSSESITENYKIWSDLIKNTRNFLSTTNINNIDNNLFVIDATSKKYSKVDPTKFNFIKLQNYSSAPLLYDKITLYFPSNYNFSSYYGFYLKVSAYDYNGSSLYPLCNFYYDKSQIQDSGGNIIFEDTLMDLGTPFIYNQKEWGKYITFSIPSVYATSNQRLINPDINIVEPDSINDHLTNGIGLNMNTPIYIEFSFINTKQIVFSVPYYYMGDTYTTTITNQPEYQTLGVMIEESTQGDFFEIFAVYNNSNEEIDDFIETLEQQGGRINIEYIVTLYEENLISGYPITYLVTENFTKKIEYRPIIKYSNTTAAIDVEMKIVDLVDNSSFSKFASIGLTSNLLKYGKTLSSLEISNLQQPKIYNYKYDKVVPNLQVSNDITNINLVKVPFPILINNYKILASNYNPGNTGDYKGMGLLNIILTPFDNIIKFQIAKQDSIDSPIIPYNLSESLLNGKLNLVFKSDTKQIEKEVYYQTDENKFEMGIVVFKINQEDILVVKQINKEKFDNFYIILNANNTSSLLYSGKFKIFENIKFLDVPTTVTSTGVTSVDTLLKDASTSTGGVTTDDAKSSAKIASEKSGGINDIIPPQFDADGIPVLQSGARGTLDSYRNLIVWIKAGLTTSQVNTVITNLNAIGVTINYAYQTPTSTGNIVLLLERIEIAKVQSIQIVPNIVNVFQLPLDYGWNKTAATSINFNQFGGSAKLNPDVIAAKSNKFPTNNSSSTSSL